MQYWLVMPAAGVGRRFGEQRPKQYAPLRGRTVIEWALAPFVADSRCAGIVVALAPGDPYWPAIEARLAGANHGADPVGANHAVPRLAQRAPILIADGGAERSGSVRNGLNMLASRAQADDWVLVHDAARPCLLARDLARLLDSVESHPSGGLLATPAADTLKRAASASTRDAPSTSTPDAASARTHESASAPAKQASLLREVEQTVDRSGLWRALTPQMFRYAQLCEALDRAATAGRFPTDEAQAVEWLGARPVLVEGSASNIKITSADDLVLAEALLGARSSGENG